MKHNNMWTLFYSWKINQIKQTNLHLHLLQSPAELFNLVLSCLESGLQLQTNKDKEKDYEIVGQLAAAFHDLADNPNVVYDAE